MLTERATPVILAVILVALSVSLISSAKAVEVCALSHGTNGTQVLIPDPHSSIPESVICSSAKALEACTVSHGTFNRSHELLIPDRQPSFPSDVQTTPPSAAADRAPLDVFGFTANLIGWLMFRRGWVEIEFGFTVSLIGWMMLLRGQEANFCRGAGFFLVAVAFFSMTCRFVPDHLAWAAQAAATVLELVFAYSLGERL